MSSSIKETNNTPYTPKAIDDPPEETLVHIFSFLPVDELTKVTPLVSHQWKRITWTAFWIKMIEFGDRNILNPSLTPLLNACKKIEKLFLSTSEGKEYLDSFFELCAKLRPDQQINFIRNIFRSKLGARATTNNPQFITFLKNIFNYPTCPIPCKMKVSEYANKWINTPYPLLRWSGETSSHSIVPATYKPFNLNMPSTSIANSLHLHQNNQFQENELVAIIDDSHLKLGNSCLYYGKIVKKEKKGWMVSLVFENNQCKKAVYREACQIGKFPLDTDLPDFCSE